MLPSEIMIWQPEFTDKILSRKPGAVQSGLQQQPCAKSVPIYVSKNWAQVNINTNNSDCAHVIYSCRKRRQ
ncbi:hypothetical protein [Escherichia coli]|uniref:hypothetical protein n=1 Tax=Escherichia coli TaxID=562 RepID=UPI00050A9137|nr:hypothetical protein [Escherichia coli]